MHQFPKSRNSDERGWVLVVAMAVMAIMLVVGIGVLKLADTQSNVTGTERIRESSLDTAEGLLYSEAAVLQKAWPRTPLQAYVNTCDNTNFQSNTVYTTQCPNATELIGAGQIFNNVDQAKNGATWKIQVRDDVGASPSNPNPLYVAGTAAGQVDSTANGCVDTNGNAAVCTYDKNGDKKLWVRAEATINGKKRMLAALLQLESFQLPFAKNAVVGGSLTVSNSGNKTVVDTTGSQVVVRCAPSPTTTMTLPVVKGALAMTVSNAAGFTANMNVAVDTTTNYEVVQIASITGNVITIKSPGFTTGHLIGTTVSIAPPNNCENWDPSKANAQVSPPANYSSNTTYPNALSPGQLAALEASADCVYTGLAGTGNAPSPSCGGNYNCPPQTNQGWSGRIVIKGPATCTINPPGNSDINSSSAPGFIVVENGTLTIAANSNYYGVIYMANQQGAANDPNNPVLTINGTGTVIGGVAVDGNGAVQLGQNLAVKFDSNAFTAFSAAGAAGLVQNTWRELTAGQ